MARATTPVRPAAGAVTPGHRMLVATLAAAFPDIDFVLNWIDPLIYLNLHRGHTHSLLLLPLWALLLAWLLRILYRGRFSLAALWRVCALGIAMHIAGDIITVYGTRIFMPLSGQRISLPTTFIIDPLFTGIILLGLLLSRYLDRRRVSRGALGVLVLYVGLQGLWHQQAMTLARDYARAQGLDGAEIVAMPQPLSPLHWKLLVVDGENYHQAYVRLYSQAAAQQAAPAEQAVWWRRLAALYQPPAALDWQLSHRFGDSPQQAVRARHAWALEGINGFREFAVYPALRGISHESGQLCIWFVDLRFVIGDMPPPFRYGMCSQRDAPQWTLQRLPRGYDDRVDTVPP